MTATFRKLALSAFLTVSAIGTLTMTSCNKDETCDAGYEGKDCATEVRAKFLGTWTANDKTGTSTTLVYTVPVSVAPSVTSILIGNKFSDDFFTNNITANVSGTTFTIPEQSPDGSTGYKVKGDGSITNGKITVNYTLTQPVTGTTQNYTGTWSK
jgi:hypothetical protein